MKNISVVSRNDLIGEYIGQTSEKTNRILESSIGKILIIDEAFIINSGDSFGYECLNTIKLFLKKNPNKIIVILPT